MLTDIISEMTKSNKNIFYQKTVDKKYKTQDNIYKISI